MSKCSYLVVLLGFLWPLTITAESAVVTADRVRIQAHLAAVETELRARDVSHLAPELQAERTRNIRQLHEYRQAGVFPHNTYVSGRTPVFIDAEDRACAVGHLIIESGHEDAARRIASRENLARLPEMRSPEVTAWLATSGLTAAEATRIQPSYEGTFCGENCPCDRSSADRPVCGSNGVTYYNSCAAEACEQFVYSHGCCEAVPENVVEDERDGPCLDLSEYCPANVAALGPPWDVDPPPGEKPDVGGCVVGAPLASTPAPPWFMLAVVFVMTRSTRRRDRARPRRPPARDRKRP